jgi:hypothetical protein
MTSRGALIVVASLALLFGAACAQTTPDVDPAVSPSASGTPSLVVSPTKEPPPDPVSLVAVGDIACDPTSPYFKGMPGYCEQESVARRVARLVEDGADWFVPLGDLQYETGGYEAFTRVYGRSFGRFDPITQPIAGNHEWYTAGAAGYFKYFGKRAGTPRTPWRTFEPMPGWQVLLLDSNCEYVGGCGPDSRQGRWLKRTLDASTADCVVAAWHHPLRTSGEYAGVVDSAARAKDLWRMADAGGVDIVLNGHDHVYERFRKFGGVQQFTVGTGGKAPYDITTDAPGSQRVIGDEYGVLLLNMRAGGTYGFQFISTEGEVLDRGRESCTNGADS